MWAMAPVVWTEERIVDALQRWVAAGGDSRIASYKVWTRGRADAPADVTIARVFGGWRNALRAAELEPSAHAGIDPDRS